MKPRSFDRRLAMAVLVCVCCLGADPASAATPADAAPATRPSRRSFSAADLSDPDPEVRRKALQTLQHMYVRPYNAAPAVIKIAAAEIDQTVREEAIRTLEVFYSTQDGRPLPAGQAETRDQAIATLAANIDSADLPLQLASIRALRNIGRPAASVSGKLGDILKMPQQQQLKIDAAAALVRIDASGEQTLRAVLQGHDEEAQYAALWALRGSKDPQTHQAILPLLNSDQDKLVVAAIETLGSFKTEQSRDAIVPFLKSPKPQYVTAALRGLFRAKAMDEALLSQIEALCASDDEGVRAVAIRTAATVFDAPRLNRIIQKAENDESASVISAVNYARRIAAAATRPATSTSTRAPASAPARPRR